MPVQHLASALHVFGSDTSRRSLTASKGIRKGKRNKIGVQPDAVKRRKNTNGSKQKQSKGNSQVLRGLIPNNTHIQGKRVHNFTKNVLNNEPVPKKAGRLMASVAKSCRTNYKRK